MQFNLVCFLSLFSASVQAEMLRFEDDRGMVFTRDSKEGKAGNGKATVAVRAGVGGVSLYDMGMTADQLIASWGLWAIRGSDFDPEDYGKETMYPDADPDKETSDFLASSINVSPSCWKNPRGCFRFDNVTDLINMKDEIDYLLMIDNGSSGFAQDYKDYPDGGNGFMKAERAGMEWIFIDTFYDTNPGCRHFTNATLKDPSNCFGRSMIDIARRIEELAIFLGVDVDEGKIEKEKEEACAAANEFTLTMKEAHKKDMRFKAVILGSRDGSYYIRDFDPTTLWVPRTMEELGAPLGHAKLYNSTLGERRDVMINDYFVDCEDNLVNSTCNANTIFPIDFWFIDSRSFLLVDDTLLSFFPDRALTAGQYWHYPRNDGPISYRSITSMLNSYSTRIQASKKVTPSSVKDDKCLEIDPKQPWANGYGLDKNEFICYDEDLIQKEYLTCSNTVALARKKLKFSQPCSEIENSVCTGSCKYKVKGTNKCEVKTEHECGCSCVIDDRDVKPNCKTVAKRFQKNKKRICNPYSILEIKVSITEEEECKNACVYNPSCTAYQFNAKDIPKKDKDTPQCMLFKGMVEVLKKVKKGNVKKMPCYYKEVGSQDTFDKQDGFCKLTSTSQITSGKSENACQADCANDQLCLSYMYGDDVCVSSFFTSKVKEGTKSKNDACYTPKN